MNKFRIMSVFVVLAMVFTIAGVSLVGTTTAVAASTNLVINGSFEQQDVSSCEWVTVGPGGTFITGWTVTGGPVDIHVGQNCPNPWGVPDGKQGVDLNGSGRGLHQDIATTAGQKYQLSFWMAGNACQENIKSFDVLFGGTVIDMAVWDRTGKSIFNADDWEYHSYEVTATSSVSQLAFVSTTPISPADWCGPAIDAVELVALNVAPTAVAGGPYLVAVGQQVAFDGSGSSDPDGDSLTESWSADGGAVAGSTYTAGSVPGIYDVQLVVNDETVDSLPATTMVVVYDPSAGFVTGGGWIDSPVNEEYQYMQVGGRANFGFVAKYKKGATVPDGNTQFQFRTGDLNFHSSSYEWLVVAGNQAMFKGEGTINGQGSYKFMITADDDSPDTFRIKIWYEENGLEVVVYDNGSQQSLGGGSIKVHK